MKGTVAPGIVESIEVSRKTKLDKKVAPGANGATLTFQGYELAEVTISMKCWREPHLERLQLLLESILPKPGKEAPKPRDFVHPILVLHGLKSLFVESVDGPTMPDADGIVKYTLNCIEFAPPPKKVATSTPKQSQAAIAGFGNALDPAKPPNTTPSPAPVAPSKAGAPAPK
jgi:hypothetical protein